MLTGEASAHNGGGNPVPSLYRKVQRLSVRYRVQYLLVRYWKCILTQIY